MRNPHELVYRSLIQVIAYYGRGVGQSTLDVTNFWGYLSSPRTRDRCLLKLTEKLGKRWIQYASGFGATTYCINNFQHGQHVNHILGGHSSTFLSGTHQMACQSLNSTIQHTTIVSLLFCTQMIKIIHPHYSCPNMKPRIQIHLQSSIQNRKE